MATVIIKRPLAVAIQSTAIEVSMGVPTASGSDYYVPMVVNDSAAVPIGSPNAIAVGGQSKLKASTAGAFDTVRVGDVVSELSTGSLTVKPSVVLQDCYLASGTKIISYPDSPTSRILDIRAGDAVLASADVDADTVVDRIDYAARTIYLSKPLLAGTPAIKNVTIKPVVRVTAVRLSTATADANEIDIDTTVATGAAQTAVTIVSGVREAVMGILRIQPLSNTTGSRLTVGVGVATPSGKLLIADVTGGSGLNPATQNYVSIGTFGIDADTWLTDIRVPRA
ncbi:hypothetical protein [Chroococcidiopsis sp.]|uniref:hypothetical protein n=1 Tax=Chroococcidiopsis sp. TaxID=3088168 RepID=UPI003F30ECAA